MKAQKLDRRPQLCGSTLWNILSVLGLGAIVATASLFIMTQKIKTSTDYALCQRALNNADAGAHRAVSELINTPDSDGNGVYDDPPTISVYDSYDKSIYDIDQNNINDFWQLFSLNKNVPDMPNVSRKNAITLFQGSKDQAQVWMEANKPYPYQAIVHSTSIVGRCSKTVNIILKATTRGGYGSRGVVAPIVNAVAQ